jgi:serine/threonine protein kinase
MLRHFRQGIAALRALTASGAPPSIVRFFDADDSQLAFSMTLVEGSDLTDIARRGWTIERKLQVFSGVCEAVRFAHQKGILHGDLRPANILYDEAAGCPVVTDFELADVSALETTTLSTSYGSYAAPEQRQGRRERLLESDIYSLGRLLQFLLTERDPEESAALGVGDEPIARIIATCTRPNPAERYGDVDELQGEVRRLRAGLSVEAARQSPHPPTPIPAQELPALTRQSLTSQNDLAAQHLTSQDGDPAKPRRTIGWLVAAAALAALGVSVGAPAFQYLSGLVSGMAAAPAVSPPDAGASSVPGKKPRRPPKRPKAPTSQKGDNSPSIAGETISRLFRDNGAAFQRCHSDIDLPVADLTGRVTTRFKVDAEGLLSEARLLDTSVKATAVAECVAKTHNGLRLDEKPGQPTYAQSRYDIGR